MKLLKVLLPVVTVKYEETLRFYLELTQGKISREVSNDFYRIGVVEDFLILSPSSSEDPMTVERKVNAIFIVDDLEAYWNWLKDHHLQILIAPQYVITGRRFVVEQYDGKIIEYLQLLMKDL